MLDFYKQGGNSDDMSFSFESEGFNFLVSSHFGNYGYKQNPCLKTSFASVSLTSRRSENIAKLKKVTLIRKLQAGSRKVSDSHVELPHD